MHPCPLHACVSDSKEWFAQAEDSTVVLDNVEYGITGAFAINIWIKVDSLNGNVFEYIYSHNSTHADATSWGPNQVLNNATCHLPNSLQCIIC